MIWFIAALCGKESVFTTCVIYCKTTEKKTVAVCNFFPVRVHYLIVQFLLFYNMIDKTSFCFCFQMIN